MDLLRAIVVSVILDMSDVTSYSDVEHIQKFTVAIGWEPDQEGMATRKPASEGMATRKPALAQRATPKTMGMATLKPAVLSLLRGLDA